DDLRAVGASAGRADRRPGGDRGAGEHDGGLSGPACERRRDRQSAHRHRWLKEGREMMAIQVETGLDPFTIEIIKDELNAIGDEMFVSLQRTSKSPIIYEVLDYCCGITDDQGQLLAQGNGVGGFLGTMAFAVQSTLEKFGRKGLQDGDIIVTNDPY